MIDLGSIRWNAVGGDNLPVSTVNEINEAKASLLLLNLYYKGEITRYAGDAILRYPHLDYVFKCNIVLEPTDVMAENTLSSFQIMNGIPHFPLLHFYMPKPGNGTFLARYVPSMLMGSYTLFKLFPREKLNGKREMHHYSEIEQSLHFFAADTRPFGPFALETKRFKLSPLHTTSSPEEGEDLSGFQDNLSDLVKDGYRDSRDFSLGGYRSIPGLTTCVDFRDKYGTPNMRLSKAYRLLKNRFHKCYIPMTCWYVKHNNRSTCLITNYVDITPCDPKLYDSSYFYVPIGFPDRQPLYNLDLLEDAEAVVMCNSPENAEALQEANDIEETGIAFTGFICDPGQYDEVDFSPLKGKTVFIEISNHNGMSMAESCLEVKKLYDFLFEDGIKDIRFILREIKYPDMTEVSNLDELLKTTGGNPPTVDTDSILLDFDKEQFDIILGKAQEEIARKQQNSQDKPFWGADQKPENKEESESEEEEDPYASLIMRPILNRGMTTLIVGEPFVGKTAFSMAMGAYLRGCKNHFLENWYWTRHNKEPQDEKSTKIEKIDYKVVYLYFDSGGSTLLNQFRKDFCPGIQKNDPLFIVDDVSGNNIDYSREENFGKFLGLLPKYENDGRTIDVLFIDTAARFANQDRIDFAEINKFISFFNSRRKDVALVFTHHAPLNRPEAYGGAVTYASVRNCCILYRTDKQKKAINGTPTLENPFSIKVRKSVSSSKISSDLISFNAYLHKNCFSANVGVFEQARRLCEIVKAYEKDGLKRPKIASLLDCSVRSLQDYLKEANKNIKEAPQNHFDDEFEDEDDDEIEKFENEFEKEMESRSD